MNFGAVHADGRGRTDSEAGFVSPDRHHCDGYHTVDHNLFTDAACQNQHDCASLLGGDSPQGHRVAPGPSRWSHEDNPCPHSPKKRSHPIELILLGASFSRAASAKENGVWVGIFVLARTKKIVLLRTRDVRQIRRTVLGMRKAPGMKSYCWEVYTLSRAASSPLYSGLSDP
jgi:hypothetical protein